MAAGAAGWLFRIAGDPSFLAKPSQQPSSLILFSTEDYLVANYLYFGLKLFPLMYEDFLIGWDLRLSASMNIFCTSLIYCLVCSFGTICFICVHVAVFVSYVCIWQRLFYMCVHI